jgi:hypothetical protein
MAREGAPLSVIQRQLGHSNLGITSVYRQSIDNREAAALTDTPAPAPLIARSSEASRKQQHGEAGSARRPECRVAWKANGPFCKS